MDSKYFIIIAILLLNTYSTSAQNAGVSCLYSMSVSDYSCILLINNPNGYNNFTSINGTHLAGKTNADVTVISSNSQSNTLNVPSIICEKFKNVKKIILYLSKIQRIHDYSFEKCEQLLHLELISNMISRIDEDAFEENSKLERLYIGLNPLTDLPEDLFDPLENLKVLSFSRSEITTLRPEWFEPLENLETLWIYENPISEFPKRIFKPLKNLQGLYSQKCNLKTIHSDSFGIHPQLTTFSFHANQIGAIDERLIDNTNVTYFYMTMNDCADVNITDTSASRQSMRTALRDCFGNYDELYPGTTTTTRTTTTTTRTTTPTTTTTAPTTTVPTTTVPTTTVPTTTTPITTPTTTTTIPTTTITTTSNPLPPGCNAGNLDERVCKIEDTIEEFHENFKDIRDENKELTEALNNQTALITDIIEENQQQKVLIEELQKELIDKSDSFSKSLEDLQEQVLILSTRPCSCH